MTSLSVRPITLETIQEARTRIRDYVRLTPLIEPRLFQYNPLPENRLIFKLENMQITGAFKSRGAMNMALSLPREVVARGLITASGGNHGLGVAYVGKMLNVPATIYLGGNAPRVKSDQIAAWGAKPVVYGADFEEASREAYAVTEREGLTYIHSFRDPEVIAGQGTISLEIAEQFSALIGKSDTPSLPDVLVASIGGGGMISGVAIAAKALSPEIRIIGVEPVGAPTLYESRKAGRVVELDAIHTKANTLSPRLSSPLNFALVEKTVDSIVLVSDEEMQQAARWLWEELGIGTELGGAAATAAILTHRVPVLPGQTVGVIICGFGTAGIV